MKRVAVFALLAMTITMSSYSAYGIWDKCFGTTEACGNADCHTLPNDFYYMTDGNVVPNGMKIISTHEQCGIKIVNGVITLISCGNYYAGGGC